MSDRYTSPNLSQQLTKAGLETKPWESPRWRYVDDELTVHPSWRLLHACAPELATVRALDLTDVLDELTRDREGGPLLGNDESMNLDVAPNLAKMNEVYEIRIRRTSGNVNALAFRERGNVLVEAAGLVLLALLWERKQ